MVKQFLEREKKVFILLSFVFVVLNNEEKLTLIKRSLKSQVCIERASPPLLDDLVYLLISYGRVTAAQVFVLPSPRCLRK